MPYEQELERRDVAIRSMHKMWHSRLREELLALGLTRDQATLAFADQPFPRTERDIFDTIHRVPAVAPAAEKLIAHYVGETWESRQDYYRRKVNTRETVSSAGR